MFDQLNADSVSISIRLNELKSDFDRSMREGTNFEQVKKIYLQIKELKCYLNVISWKDRRL